jgi:hypothetical protein
MSFSGMFTLEERHFLITVCPRHRAEYGIRWRSCKVRCAVPSEIAGHKSATAKGDRHINSSQSEYILKKTGKLIEVGSRK